MKIHFYIPYLFFIISISSCIKERIQPSVFSLNHGDSLIIEKNEKIASYQIYNTTNQTIKLFVESTDTILVPLVKSYSMPSNSSSQVQFKINKKYLPDGTYYGTFYLVDGLNRVAVPYRLLSYNEKKTSIINNITDAEYYKKTDKVVFVGNAPNMLYVFHTLDKTIDSIALPYAPTCVSISPDGDKALVGQDKMLSQIDLKALKVLKSTKASFSIYDVVYANNDIAYISPLYQDNLKYINLNTGLETKYADKTLYGQSRMKMHPSGKYLYVLDQFLISNPKPYHILKFNIENNTPTYVSQSPFSDQTVYWGDFWINEEGDMLIDNMMNMLQISDNPALDLAFTNTIYYTDFTWFTHLDICKKKNIIASILYKHEENNFPTILALFDLSTLDYIKTIEPEAYLVDYNGQTISQAATPSFVFISSNGEKLILISKSASGRRGIEVINVD